MADVSQWSPIAANNTQDPPDGWPEGMARAAVNDTARETHASVRRWAEEGGWFDWGHTPTYVSATVFQVPGDQRAVYTTNRRVRAVQVSQTIYGTIVSSAFTTNTDVTVTWDSLQLLNEIPTTVSVGPEPTTALIQTIPTLGTAAFEDVGTAIGNVVQLENVTGNAGLPAVDGSQLFNLPPPTPTLPTLLEDRVASAATGTTFETAAWFTAPYRALVFEFDHVTVSTTGAALWLRVKFGAGGYISSNNYVVGDVGVNGVPDDGWPGASPEPLFYTSNLATNRFGIAGDLASSGSVGVSGTVEVRNLQNFPTFLANVVFQRLGGGGFSGNNVYGWCNAATSGLNGVQILVSMGTFSGDIRVYGR